MATLPGTMTNYVNAHEGLPGYWFSNKMNDNSRTCINTPLQVTLPCGPTGATYSITGRQCVSAIARSSASIPDVLGIVGSLTSNVLAGTSPEQSVSHGIVGTAEAKAAAESISCDALREIQELIEGDMAAASPELVEAIRAAFAEAAEDKVAAARAQITQGSDSPTLALLADQIQAAMIEDLNAQIDAVIAQA